MNRTSHKTLWGIGDAIVIVVALVPVLWLASLSFKDPSTIADGSFLPQKWTLANYRGVFQTSLFTRALVNSIGIAVIATVLAVVIGSLAAYAVARLRFPGKGLLVAAALLIAMFPWDLERAARVDGATPFQAFTRVIAPLATPGIVTTAILVFIFCWNDFVFAISLTSTLNSRTVPAAIAFFTGASQFQTPIGSIAAAGVVITIPIIIFVFIFQRRIVAGLASGAVKG